MIKKFLIGIVAILVLYIVLSWAIAVIGGFGPEKIQALCYSGILATLNIVIAFGVLKFSINQTQKTFAKFFLSGMVLRLLGLLICIFLIFNFSRADHFVFIGSLFILYFMYQIWEVLIVNTKNI